MDILRVIQSRRSIRKYKPTPLSEETIEKILEAGRWAPSGVNNQPWRFLVVRDKEKIKGLAQFTKYGNIIEGAACVICVFMDAGDSYNRDKDILAIGACIQNMLLEAYSLGVGTCWLGEILNQKDKVCGFLKVDSDLELFAVVTLGIPDEKVTSTRRNLKNLIIKTKI